MAEASTGQPARARPLSPHLQIYRPQINMVMSILHRITGAALYFGTLLIVWWLVAAATGPDYFAFVNGLLATWPGMVIIVGFTWALIHHMLGGLAPLRLGYRHRLRHRHRQSHVMGNHRPVGADDGGALALHRV